MILKEAIEAEAKKNNRSINAEIVFSRLQASVYAPLHNREYTLLMEHSIITNYINAMIADLERREDNYQVPELFEKHLEYYTNKIHELEKDIFTLAKFFLQEGNKFEDSSEHIVNNR